ncbi:hypothetical protein [Paenibacillus tepidiphilus]|uniref:hypothetical protein n=1 Tax=Paenibacillus tepidiphilus TaxID=2608683 RepID=UPI00123B085A|nr:hypothetical protein [Paenibacillus tepidiphilus]
MKIISEYFRLFTVMMLNNKIGFVWYLIFPLVAFFVYNYSWIATKPQIETFYLNSSLFISYISFTMSIDVTTNLIAMRENGFLKMFKFVSGSKYAIVIGKYLNQLFFLLLAVLIFTVTTGTVFLDNTHDFLNYIGISLLACLLGALTVSLFLLILMLLPIKQESLTTILNMLLFVLFIASANDLSSLTHYGAILVLLNPLDYIRNLTFLIGNWISGMNFTHISTANIIAIGCIYILSGLIGLRYFKIVSVAART